MSEPIPESIPTSADPRSKRPLKKRLLNQTPTSETASAISSLMSKPDQIIPIPTSTSLAPSSLSAPPEIVQNVQGSSAGAGSGEFHVYKASRRREYERLRGMDEEVRREVEGEEWERGRRERETKDEEKTRRNRERRMKKRKVGGKGGDGENGGGKVDKEGKIKARVVVREGMEGLGGEGKEDGGENGNGGVVEEVGVIIHDDD